MEFVGYKKYNIGKTFKQSKQMHCWSLKADGKVMIIKVIYSLLTEKFKLIVGDGVKEEVMCSFESSPSLSNPGITVVSQGIEIQVIKKSAMFEWDHFDLFIDKKPFKPGVFHASLNRKMSERTELSGENKTNATTSSKYKFGQKKKKKKS